MKKSSQRTTSVFDHIWRSIAALVVVVFLIAGTAITLYVRQTTRAEIETQEKAYLMDVDTMVVHQLSSAQQILNMLLTNPFIVQSIYTGNQSWNTEAYWSGQIIVNAINSNQIYNSIYVISGDQVAIKSSRRYLSGATEEKLIASMQTRFPQGLIPWRSEVGSRIDYNLMVLAPLEAVSIPNHIGGALVNIDLGRLSDLVFANRGSRKMFLVMDDQVIAAGKAEDFFASVSDHPILQLEPQERGSLYQGQYMISLTNRTYGYTLYSVQDYNALMAPVTRGLLLLFAVLSLLILLALLLSRQVARHAYVPVKTILIELEEKLPGAGEEEEASLSEVQRVSRSIRRTSEIVSAYRRDAEAVRLSRFIHSGTPDEGSKALLEETLEWGTGEGVYMTLIRAESPEDARMTSDVLQGYLSGNTKFLTLDVPGQRLLSIIHFLQPEGNAGSVLQESIDQVLQLMRRQGSGKIVAAVQPVTGGIDSLKSVYGQLDERMRNWVFCEGNACLPDTRDAKIPTETVQRICQNALEMEETDFLQAERGLLDACRLVPAREAYHQLATICMRISDSASGKNLDVTDRLDSYREHLNALYSLSDYPSLFAYIQNLRQRMINHLNDRKASGSNPLTEQVLSYIQAHFDDPGLSAGQVADVMGISVSYLSRIINKSQGYGFPETLQRMRLEYAAAQLLARPELSITDLSQQSGFSSASYFTASFKKMYGMTPSSYRQERKGISVEDAP